MKTVQLILLIIISFTTKGQNIFDMQSDNYCNKANFYQDYFIKSKDIIQTPLLHDYDVKFYHLDLQVENNSIAISGNVIINAQVVATQLDTFAFELMDEVILDSAKINNVLYNTIRLNDEVFIPLTEPLINNQLFSAQIFYHSNESDGDLFTGISTEYDTTWQKHVTWTLSEPFNARQWWPVKQVLTDKADSVWVFLTTSDANKAGSIGLLTAVTPMPDNKLRYEWKSQYPISYYLISLAVAEYQEINLYAHPSQMGDDSLLIQNYIYDSPGCYENYKDGIENTDEFLELFSDLFSLYPFHEEKYGHCLTSIGGGMEHQTMTTIKGFGFGLVAHELGHMWFGDNITCATWSDIWINEGFATYADYLAHEFLSNPIYPPIWLRLAHETVLLEPDGSVYVPPEEVTYDNVYRIFDSRLSYRKGALLLHMIRFELQDDNLFFQVFKDYQSLYSDSVATGIDFMNVLNATTGKDFTNFFDTWYFGEGYPIYNVNWLQDEEDFQLTSIQNASAPDITPFFSMIMPYKIFFNDGTDTTLKLPHTSIEMTYNFSFQKLVDSIQVDPDRWVIHKVESLIGIPESLNPIILSLAPNPVRDILELIITDQNTEFIEIKIFSLEGRLIKVIKTYETHEFIDISDLSASTYIIQVEWENKKHAQKFIKID